MSHEIPFRQAKFQPPDAVLKGNSTSPTPVVFHLSPAGGADLARIKSIIVATIGLTSMGDWSPETQQSVISSFTSGESLYDRTVDLIENLTIPAPLARKVGIPVDPPTLEKVPVTTGAQFTKIAGYVSSLALLVAFEIAKLSRELDELDPRFFEQPSGSISPATPARTSGTAGRVGRRRGKRATAG
jgi:hypothetical protein